MDFNKLIEYLTDLVNFVKPVGGLISDFYQELTSNITEFGMLADVFKWILIIVGIIYLLYRVLGD